MAFALHGGAGTLLAAAELLTGDITNSLERFLAAQPTWSDLPIIVVGANGEDLSVPTRCKASATCHCCQDGSSFRP